MAALSWLNRPWLRTLGLAGTLVALFFLLWQSDEPSELTDAETLRGDAEPDGFVVTGHYLSYNDTGRLKTEVRSRRIEQFESRSEIVMAMPRATLYGDQADDPPWQVEAREGRFLQSEDLVYLTGDVRVTRETGSEQPLTLTTTALTMDNNESTVYTDRPVRLTDALGLTTATGMKAWIDDRILELDSQVEGLYEPAQ